MGRAPATVAARIVAALALIGLVLSGLVAGLFTLGDAAPPAGGSFREIPGASSVRLVGPSGERVVRERHEFEYRGEPSRGDVRLQAPEGVTIVRETCSRLLTNGDRCFVTVEADPRTARRGSAVLSVGTDDRPAEAVRLFSRLPTPTDGG